jgi:hypothetical protein
LIKGQANIQKEFEQDAQRLQNVSQIVYKNKCSVDLLSGSSSLKRFFQQEFQSNGSLLMLYDAAKYQ